MTPRGARTRPRHSLIRTFRALAQRPLTAPLFTSMWLEYALCLQLLPERMQLPTVELASVLPGAEAVAIEVDALPGGGWRTVLDDLVVLLKIARFTSPRRVLELGSYRGLTAAYLARNTDPGSRIVAVDIDPAHGSAYRGTALEQRIERRTGAIGPELFGDEERGSYELIFVDAGHSFDDVARDTEWALKLAAPHAHIVWHDYINSGFFNGYNEVPEFLHQLAGTRRVLHLAGSSLAIHSPAWAPPPTVEHSGGAGGESRPPRISTPRRERGDRSSQQSAPQEPPPIQDELLERASAADAAVLRRALPYTMTGSARVMALIDAVRYCVKRGVPGAFAECGVWRGGSVLAMILTLQQLGIDDRDIYLYDTFEGMTAPTEADTSVLQGSALEAWNDAAARQQRAWPELFGAEAFNEHSVRALILESGYPPERLRFVAGRVEDTIPATVPKEIALLRLDTDWYESTRHELTHLYPRLASGGVMIVDDYGHWDGARRAVDEYFLASGPEPLLMRIDYSARIAVK